jgi:hypothetical protein
MNNRFDITRNERVTTYIAALVCFLLLVLQFYRWEIIDVITPFLQWPLEILIYTTFFSTLVIIIFLGVLDFKKGRKFRLAISSLMIMTYAFTIFVNFNGLWLSHYFNKYKDQRNEVIRMIEDQKLLPNVEHDSEQIHLPSPLDKTSMGGGDIMFNFSSTNRQVFFFSFRGILDAYAGFYYSSEDIPPERNLMGLEFRDSIKLEKHWYWIGTCNKASNEALGVLLDLAPILRCS